MEFIHKHDWIWLVVLLVGFALEWCGAYYMMQRWKKTHKTEWF